jgi:hypothetical protein
MAPELLENRKNKIKTEYANEFAADMFAFGITLFEAVFLISPFENNCADPEDPLFGPFFSNNFMKFW